MSKQEDLAQNAPRTGDPRTGPACAFLTRYTFIPYLMLVRLHLYSTCKTMASLLPEACQALQPKVADTTRGQDQIPQKIYHVLAVHIQVRAVLLHGPLDEVQNQALLIRLHLYSSLQVAASLPQALGVDQQHGEVAKLERHHVQQRTTSWRSTYNTRSGRCFFMAFFMVCRMRLLLVRLLPDMVSPGVSMKRSPMPRNWPVTTRTCTPSRAAGSVWCAVYHWLNMRSGCCPVC